MMMKMMVILMMKIKFIGGTCKYEDSVVEDGYTYHVDVDDGGKHVVYRWYV